MNKNFRAPSIPLVTVDPYFSVWSPADKLYEACTVHWTNKPNEMVGLISIDGKVFSFLGKTEQCNDVITQKSLEVKPLSTIYTFESKEIRLEVNFTTPLLMDDLDLLSRPVSYITFKVNSLDGKPHDVKIYFDVTGEWCVDSPEQKIVWNRKKIAENIEAMSLSHEKQEVLNKPGDDVRIDWGYFYLTVPQYNKDVSTFMGSHKVREDFIHTQSIPEKDEKCIPRDLVENKTVMAVVLDFEKVDSEIKSGFVSLAYDDIKSIEYFGKQLDAVWKRTGLSFEEMLVKSIDEYNVLMEKCDSFNKNLISEAAEVGGEDYAELVSLGYRQAIAAHKTVCDEDGKILFFSKECFSNGCIATVDVTYPSIPLFLLYNTELVKGMLRPVYKYYNMDEWKFDFAPHDVGCYPKANGQVYGENKLEYQMPVEECGNMLIATAAVSVVEKNADFALENFEALTDWVKYLEVNGFDPGNQLCTDDFAGHLAHNANLSIKAILGIASYALICDMLGKKEEYEHYLNLSKDLAAKWEETAREEDHYKLTFDSVGTWSLKYNLVWDTILDLNIFSKEISRKEISYYLKKQNKYGIPLDSRADYTKTDWIVWSATMAEKLEDFKALVKPIRLFIEESESRVPFTDWYFTSTGKQRGFQHRSVIGGIFIKLLKERLKK